MPLKINSCRNRDPKLVKTFREINCCKIYLRNPRKMQILLKILKRIKLKGKFGVGKKWCIKTGLIRSQLVHRRLVHADSAALLKLFNIKTVERPMFVPHLLSKFRICTRENIKNWFSKKKLIKKIQRSRGFVYWHSMPIPCFGGKKL